MLGPYGVSERRAILVHKYYLGTQLGYDPGLGQAVTSWESRVAGHWRRERQIADCQAQLSEIERHREMLIRQRRADISMEEAGRDWILRFAAEWRKRREEIGSG